MSANLLDGLAPRLYNGTTEDGGVFHKDATTGHYDLVVWNIEGQAALKTNQTYHVGLSVRGAATSVDSLTMAVGYKDAAGKMNWVKAWLSIHTSWGRCEGTVVVPSGMTPFAAYITTYNTGPETWMANPTLSLGSPVCLASSAHTPYATQDHVAAEYATKAALKVTSDAVTAEVEERGKLAGRVGTLESTTGTHTSKLEQLAASIKSLVKGESTYTDPDGKSATSGIYSLVTQTRDSVTALFGSYTKTADLASTQAVRDARKAGTDAQAAASAAQTTADSAKSTAQAAASDAATAKTNAASAVSTANSASTSAANAVKTANAASSTASSASSKSDSAVSTANAAKTSAASAVSTANSASSTANTAKSTADSLATLIRADSTGITVGKSADGKTYSTGRTHMDEDSFDILDKAGATVAQLAADGVSLLSGLVRIVAGKVSLPGADSVDSITIDAGGGVATVSGLISRLSGLYNGISSTVTAGFAMHGGNGITATVRDTKSNIVANAILGVDKATVGIGGQYVKMKGDAFELSHPEYLLAALMDASKVPGSLDTCGPGVFTYNESTSNTPTSYGTCVCIRAGDGTDTGSWLFQVALPTMGDPYWRRNINGAGWEGWWVIKSQ